MYFLEEFQVAWKDSKFLKRKRFMDRTINVGSISAEQAISYGFTGPNLRAAVDYDVVSLTAYSSYDDFIL
jgi:NADH-quinone oxidoreductase subunit D